MHEKLIKFFKLNDIHHLVEGMTLWLEPIDVEKDEPEGVKGIVFEDHLGIQNVKDIAGEGLYVYGIRHGDDWCTPVDIENKEVVVNFYGYFVTDQSLDHLFTDEKDWHDIYDWSMDWGDEHYWE